MNRKPRVCCIGDIMLDIDLHCSCDRICQDGPWPVLNIERREERPGGAGNVRAMCEALGADAMLVGISDPPSKKTRLFVGGKIIGPRIDEDRVLEASEATADFWMECIEHFQPDAIIIADHGKGVVTPWLMSKLDRLSIAIYVDPVKTTPLPYRVECVCGGLDEIPEFSKQELLIFKRGNEGLVWHDGDIGKNIPSECKNCIDPLGAGDQLIATLAIRRVLGDSWKDAIETANRASGLQCERLGCVPVTMAELYC